MPAQLNVSHIMSPSENFIKDVLPKVDTCVTIATLEASVSMFVEAGPSIWAGRLGVVPVRAAPIRTSLVIHNP